MFGKLFSSKDVARDQLVHIAETNEWLNQHPKRTIEVMIKDTVATNQFSTHIGSGEKIGLQDGMEI